MEVHIPEEFLPFIRKNLDAGSFRSPDDLVAEALRVFKSQEEWLMENKEHINAAIEKGIKSIENGKFYTIEEAKKRLF